MPFTSLMLSWSRCGPYGRAFRLSPKMAAQDWEHVLLAFLSIVGYLKTRYYIPGRRLNLE